MMLTFPRVGSTARMIHIQARLFELNLQTRAVTFDKPSHNGDQFC